MTMPDTGSDFGPDVTPPARISSNPAPAPEAAPTPLPESRNQAEPRVFSEAEVQAIRDQEKSKVYGRLEEMQKRLALLSEREEERIKAEQEARAAAEEAERKRVESETDVRTLLEQEREARQKEIAELQQQRETERALFEKERQFQEIQNYKNNAVNAALSSDQILPELAQYVTGDTPEEIDRSIAGLVAQSESILTKTAEALQGQRQQQRTSAPTGRPNVGPLENETGQRQLTPQEIAGMSLAEFAKNRERLGVTGRRSQGLFG